MLKTARSAANLICFGSIGTESKGVRDRRPKGIQGQSFLPGASDYLRSPRPAP